MTHAKAYYVYRCANKELNWIFIGLRKPRRSRKFRYSLSVYSHYLIQPDTPFIIYFQGLCEISNIYLYGLIPWLRGFPWRKNVSQPHTINWCYRWTVLSLVNHQIFFLFFFLLFLSFFLSFIFFYILCVCVCGGGGGGGGAFTNMD